MYREVVETEEGMNKRRKRREMGTICSSMNFFFFLCFIIASASSSEIQIEAHDSENGNEKNSCDFNSFVKDFEGQLIEVKDEPNDVVWVVQLSDLHFSVHYPERALDFKAIMGSTLAMINPSLVLVTGDLTGNASSSLRKIPFLDASRVFVSLLLDIMFF